MQTGCSKLPLAISRRLSYVWTELPSMCIKPARLEGMSRVTAETCARDVANEAFG